MKFITYSQSPKFNKALRNFCDQAVGDGDVSDLVCEVLADIKSRGDAAVLQYTEKFDAAKLSASNMRVTTSEIKAAVKTLSISERKAIRESIAQVKAFHKRTVPKNWSAKNAQGARVGERYYPIGRVGLYIPGGNVPLVSTVVMTAVLAKLVGNPEIAVCTPPAKDGTIAPAMLAALAMIGVDEVYRVGGIQGIGALAYGTKTIPAVDKIFGPGNAYVALAKKKFFGVVGIDMIAGPSEILVFADKNNNPKHIAIDLLSQAEHDELAQSILITDCDNFSNNVIIEIDSLLKKLKRRNIAKKSWEKFGAVIIVEKISDGIELINKLAPEHLEIALDNAKEYLKDIKNAGAIFLGKFTPEAIGDYIAGPNHVLPTDRTARFTSGLNLLDYFKRSSVVSCTEKSIKKIGLDAINIANEEGLQAHALSIECRIKK
ncbi:MAG TPA: histidinol dehydrogenase [Opitutae bacterium]|nr:histidinol dehydrogenase [Opitutae bacterium]